MTIQACAGPSAAGLAAGMNFGALSLPGGMLTAPLGAVPPNMTLLEALQTRQAQDMLSALEAARAPSRHPLDISLQVHTRPASSLPCSHGLAASPACAQGGLKQHMAIKAMTWQLCRTPDMSPQLYLRAQAQGCIERDTSGVHCR